jgi:type IV secretion system protein VirB6
LGFVAFAAAIVSVIAIGYMFALYLIAYVLLSLIIAISPIFVAALIFGPTQRFFSGWLSAAVGAITTLVLIAILLAILVKTMQQSVDLVMNAPANADIYGMIGSVIGGAALLFIGAFLVKEIKSISVGIAGGVRDGSDRALTVLGATVAGAGGAVAGWLGGPEGAVASTGDATANAVAAGRNLGRGP